MIKTNLINLFNLCVPCYNHCRYCLLSWNGNCLGIDDDHGMSYAKKFYEWLKVNRPDINFVYYFGYSMDHPRLPEVIRFMQETNSPGGEFLQLDGMKMRTKQELDELFTTLKVSGIKTVDFTFYGTKEYHDKFAGRTGDFDLMMNSMESALKIGVEAEVGVSVTKENLEQLEELVHMAEEKKIRIFLFTPHSGGRGISLLKSKITLEDYEGLSDTVKPYFNRKNNRTPMEWLENPPEEYKSRILTLSLLPSNIEKLEQQSFEETLKELEQMDEEYFKVIPSFQELLKKYADDKDKHLYTKKDLYFLYRRRFVEENGMDIPDIMDERFSGSLRY